MRKIILNLCETTQEITDDNGIMIGMNSGYSFMDAPITSKKSSIVNDMKELKAAGFTAEEIMQLKREGVI